MSDQRADAAYEVALANADNLDHEGRCFAVWAAEVRFDAAGSPDAASLLQIADVADRHARTCAAVAAELRAILPGPVAGAIPADTTMEALR